MTGASRCPPHEVRLRPAPHTRTPILSYLADRLAGPALRQLAAGPVRELRRALRVHRQDPGTRLCRRPGCRSHRHQSVRLLHRGVGGEGAVHLFAAAARASSPPTCRSSRRVRSSMPGSRGRSAELLAQPMQTTSFLVALNQRIVGRHPLPGPARTRRAAAGADPVARERILSRQQPGC